MTAPARHPAGRATEHPHGVEVGCPEMRQTRRRAPHPGAVGKDRRTHRVVDSPLGRLTLVAEGPSLVALHLPPPPTRAAADLGEPDPHALPHLVEQLDAYFAGDLRDFDIAVAAAGTPFQQEVWAALRTIPYGTTRTYGQVAAGLGRPGASRAVGLANGRNPVAVVVPCHRVVGADGSLTGYAGGVAAKQRLLDLERGVLPGLD